MANNTLAQRIFSLIDLTSLNGNETEEQITALCAQAVMPWGTVAAICIYPQFIPLVKKRLANNKIKIAAVANFPTGTESLTTVIADIKNCLNLGADEIDVVMPYQEYLAGKREAVKNFITDCKQAAGNHILKVILETGALQDPALIKQASQDVILAGADFIKTSTGKINIGATLEAATAMLETIRDLHLSRTVGFKASGGIRTIEQGKSYLELAEKLLGNNWITPNTFRLGASQLVKEIIALL